MSQVLSIQRRNLSNDIRSYNNIILSSNPIITAYQCMATQFPLGLPGGMDNNFYIATGADPTTIRYLSQGSSAKGIDQYQMETLGYEKHSQVLNPTQFFSNLSTYTPLPQYQNAGYNGAPIGPSVPWGWFSPNNFGPQASLNLNPYNFGVSSGY
jgi:hypothetical protein